MGGAAHLETPSACTEAELREIARLVRQGFESAEDLDRRMRAARWLAWHRAADGLTVAVAALKAPDAAYRDKVFEMAGAPVGAADFDLELGWVFVVPEHRRNGIAAGLCRRLLAREAASSVFATTRPDNLPMIGILLALDFARAGRPYPRRNEELILFLR